MSYLGLMGRQYAGLVAIMPAFAGPVIRWLAVGSICPVNGTNWHYMKRTTGNRNVPADHLYRLCSKGYRL